MLAAYDARPTLGDLPSNIGVMLRRSTDGGTTWQAQQVVRKDAAPQGYGDPSLLVDRTNGRIFLFYAAGVNQGFFGSATGNDESDPNVLQADYSYSDDDGLTWTHRRITKQIKNPAWGGMFASSGEGIQLRNGAHKGRIDPAVRHPEQRGQLRGQRLQRRPRRDLEDGHPRRARW